MHFAGPKVKKIQIGGEGAKDQNAEQPQQVMVTFIDPPSGWRYGFPKVYPKEAEGRTLEWLVEQGYPQWEIDKMKNHFYCRYWEGPLEGEEEEIDLKEGE